MKRPHLSPGKVALVILVTGGAFVAMHGVHSWNGQHCRFCQFMSKA